MAIDMNRVYEAEQRESCYFEYISSQDFHALEEKAKARGFRHATLGEINASAYRGKNVSSDLYCWAGGLWVRIDEVIV